MPTLWQETGLPVHISHVRQRNFNKGLTARQSAQHMHRRAFSIPHTAKLRRSPLFSASISNTDHAQESIETAEGLREAMKPIGPVTDLG